MPPEAFPDDPYVVCTWSTHLVELGFKGVAALLKAWIILIARINLPPISCKLWNQNEQKLILMIIFLFFKLPIVLRGYILSLIKFYAHERSNIKILSLFYFFFSFFSMRVWLFIFIYFKIFAKWFLRYNNYDFKIKEPNRLKITKTFRITLVNINIPLRRMRINLRRSTYFP